MAWLSKQVNDKISEIRLVLGVIVNIDSEDNRPLDLLNENFTIDAALRLSSLSQEAVNFLNRIWLSIMAFIGIPFVSFKEWDVLTDWEFQIKEYLELIFGLLAILILISTYRGEQKNEFAVKMV